MIGQFLCINCNYASVGGATRHTVVRRFVIRSLCLGGRSHEAYSSRGVILSVSQSVSHSVATISRSSLKTNR